MHISIPCQWKFDNLGRYIQNEFQNNKSLIIIQVFYNKNGRIYAAQIEVDKSPENNWPEFLK